MSQSDDVARRDAFEDDVRTALYRPSGELRRLQYRLTGFALAVGLLVTLAPTWVLVEPRSGRTIESFSGISLSLFGFTIGERAPVSGFAFALMLGYLLLVLVLLLLPPGHISVVILGAVGLLATFLAVVNLQAPGDDGRSTSVEAHWTGAPMVAIFLWLALITNAAIATKTLSD